MLQQWLGIKKNVLPHSISKPLSSQISIFVLPQKQYLTFRLQPLCEKKEKNYHIFNIAFRSRLREGDRQMQHRNGEHYSDRYRYECCRHILNNNNYSTSSC